MKSIFLSLKNENVIKRIKVEQILFIKINNRDVLVHLPRKETFISSMPLCEFIEILPEHFMRIHRSCIVNTNKILEFDINKRKIQLVHGIKLDISVRNIKKLKMHLNQ